MGRVRARLRLCRVGRAFVFGLNTLLLSVERRRPFATGKRVRLR